jgi:hypothetical protein
MEVVIPIHRLHDMEVWASGSNEKGKGEMGR